MVIPGHSEPVRCNEEEKEEEKSLIDQTSCLSAWLIRDIFDHSAGGRGDPGHRASTTVTTTLHAINCALECLVCNV